MIKSLEEKASKIEEVKKVTENQVHQKPAQIVPAKIEKPVEKVEEQKGYLPNVRTRAKKSVPLQPLPPVRQSKR